MYPLVIVLAQVPRHEAASLLAKYGHGFALVSDFLPKLHVNPIYSCLVDRFSIFRRGQIDQGLILQFLPQPRRDFYGPEISQGLASPFLVHVQSIGLDAVRTSKNPIQA